MKESTEDIFVALLEKNQNIVHKICRLYTNDKESHNDLFQEISIQLWKAYPKFRGDAKFSTWMYRVGLNTAISLYRRSKKRIDGHDIEKVSHQIKHEEYDNSEEKQLKEIYGAIKELNDIEKAIIFMFLENKPYKEISESLGISEVNVRVKMNRIKNKLRNKINS